MDNSNLLPDEAKKFKKEKNTKKLRISKSKGKSKNNDEYSILSALPPPPKKNKNKHKILMVNRAEWGRAVRGGLNYRGWFFVDETIELALFIF